MSALPLAAPPQSLCLFRLSALGDCVNIVPIVRTLQRYWPQTRLTWVIGKFEHSLVGNLPGVEFIVLDKKAGRQGRLELRRQLTDRRFDVLLHMHAGWRANMSVRMIPADIRVGFNRERSRDLQSLFVNTRITSPAGRHVFDGFFGFLETLGLQERELDWSLPIAAEDKLEAAEILPADTQSCLLISPCSSHSLRNWRPERYAAVADFAIKSLNMRVVLVGGPSATEGRMGDEIQNAMGQTAVNLIGQCPLGLLTALLERAQILISPDAGPAHMANITQTPVIALHAATDSTRSGPYSSLEWCVDRFDEAAMKFLGKPANRLKWGTKIEREGVMDLVTVDDVTTRLSKLSQILNSNDG